MVGKKTGLLAFSASIAATVLGQNKYESPNKLLQKYIRAKHGQVTDFGQNLAMLLGDLLEDMLIRIAAARLGFTEVETEHEEAYKHPFYPAECSLDGSATADNILVERDPENHIYVPEQSKIICNGFGVIENKVTNAYPSDDAPPLWRGVTQLKVQMEICDASWGMLSVFHHAVNEQRLYFYERDPAFAKELKEMSEDWQRRVETEEYYNPETSEDAYIMYEDQELDDEVIELDKKAIDICAQIEHLDTIAKNAEKTKDSLQATLMTMMGNAKKAVVGDYSLDWGVIKYKAVEEHTKLVEAKPAREVRRKNIRIKQVR